MSNKNWVVAYSCTQMYLAEMAVQMLSDQSIEAVVVNKMDSSYHFGEIEVQVEEENFEKARSFIEQFDNNTSLE